MIVVHKDMWRWLLFLVFLTASAVVICAFLYLALQDKVHENRGLLDANRFYISQLQAQDRVLKAHDVTEAQKQSVRRRSFLALQAQVRKLGGTPLPLPPTLRTDPAAPRSTGAAPAPAPRQTPAATSRPTRPSSPPPSPPASHSASPRPTSTPSCRVSVGPVCVQS